MRRIDKGPAPPCLADCRREARRIEKETGEAPRAEDWNPGACAQPVRDALHRDQHGLCGYCMQRVGRQGCRDLPVPFGNRGMRIEHLTPREHEPRRMYDWANLLGVCGGRSGGPSGEVFDHCDRSRGSRKLRLNPTKGPRPEDIVSYRRCPETDGLLIDAAPPYDADVSHLALNNPALARRRRDAERAIARLLARARPGTDRRRLLERLLAGATTPDPNGELPEFAPVVVRYIQRKLGG